MGWGDLSPQSKLHDRPLLPGKIGESVNPFLSGTMVGVPDTWCGVNCSRRARVAQQARQKFLERLLAEGAPTEVIATSVDICMGPGNGNPATTTSV